VLSRLIYLKRRVGFSTPKHAQYADELSKIGKEPTESNLQVMTQLETARGVRYFKGTLVNKDYTLMWKNLVGKDKAKTLTRPSNEDILQKWNAKFVAPRNNERK